MTNKTRYPALQPLGRGPLHSSPTMESARQAALRAWARERRRDPQKDSPVDSARIMAKREDDSPRR